LAEADRLHIAADVLDRVVDGRHRAERAAGGVDVQRDVPVRIQVLEVHELRHHVIGRGVVDGRSQKDDPLVQQLGVRVEGPLPVAGAFGELRQDIAGGRSVHGTRLLGIGFRTKCTGRTLDLEVSTLRAKNEGTTGGSFVRRGPSGPRSKLEHMAYEIPVTQARAELADLINRVVYGGER